MSIIAEARARVLRQIMFENKLTANAVARIIHREPQTVRAYKCGVRPIPQALLLKLLGRFLDVRVSPKRIDPAALADIFD